MVYSSSDKGIAMISKNDTEKNMLMAYNKVVAITKAFDGDVFGGYIRDWRICSKTSFNDIDVRIEPMYYKCYLKVLSMDFVIKQKSKNCNYASFDLCFKTKEKTTSTISLDVVTVARMFWLQYPIDFDINGLAENNTSMYVRGNAFDNIVDPLNHIKERICQQAMSLVCCKEDDRDKINKVERAIKFIKGGWFMDDNVLGRRCWVVAFWKNIRTQPRRIRLYDKDNDIKLMTEHSLCSCCHELFQDNDIVVNTPCNHNFHWICKTLDHSECPDSGLKCWLWKHNKNSCPACREKIFE